MPRGTTEASVKDPNPCCMATDSTNGLAYILILKISLYEDCFLYYKGQTQWAS